MDKKDVKKAIDDFENDNFVDSKEMLQKIVKDKVSDYLNKELKLDTQKEEE